MTALRRADKAGPCADVLNMYLISFSLLVMDMTSSLNTRMDACTLREFRSLRYRYTNAATPMCVCGGVGGKVETPAESIAAQINISPDP